MSEREKILNPKKKSCEVVDTPIGRINTLFATRDTAKLFVRELCTKGSGGRFSARQGGSGGKWVDFICRTACSDKYIKWKKAGKKESEWPNVEVKLKDREPVSVPMCGFRVCFRKQKRENPGMWRLVTPLDDENLAVWKHHEKCTGQYTLSLKELQKKYPDVLLAAPRAAQALDNPVQK